MNMCVVPYVLNRCAALVFLLDKREKTLNNIMITYPFPTAPTINKITYIVQKINLIVLLRLSSADRVAAVASSFIKFSSNKELKFDIFTYTNVIWPLQKRSKNKRV